MSSELCGRMECTCNTRAYSYMTNGAFGKTGRRGAHPTQDKLTVENVPSFGRRKCPLDHMGRHMGLQGQGEQEGKRKKEQIKLTIPK
jgi:hypothetical protein